MSVMLRPRAPVFHWKCSDYASRPQQRLRFAFAPIKFRDVGKAGSFQQIARGARGDHACSLIKTTECSQIEMIKVRMRQKDNVDMRQVMKLERGRSQSFRADGESWQTNSDPRKKDGIGENCDAEKIDEHRGVP